MKANKSDVATLFSPEKKPTSLPPKSRQETCLFLHAESSHPGTTPIPKRTMTAEDIRVIMPASWKFAISCNVITISDTNDQSIRIVFQNPIEASFDLEKTNPASYAENLEPDTGQKICSEVTTSGQNSNARENRIPIKECAAKKLIKSPIITNDSYADKPAKPYMQKKQTGLKPCSLINNNAGTRVSESRGQHPRTMKISWMNSNILNNKSVSEICLQSFTSSDSQIAKLKTNFLSLETPLLMKYRDGNKRSHILMYKFHSVQENSNATKCSEIVENLLKGSVPYVGDPVYWLFNPQRQVRKLKRIEKLSSISGHSSCADNDSMKTFANTTLNKNADSYKKKGRFLMPDGSFGTKLPNRERMSRAYLKQVNVRQIATSIFVKNFHFFSRLGGHLKSGAVITRSNSTYWLMMSGVATDFRTRRLAADLFTAVAGMKIVLNIYDYLRFLIAFARTERIILKELVKQMTICRQPSFIVFK